MKNLSDDTKSFLSDMLKSEGWSIYKGLIGEQVNTLRQMATQKEVGLEDRLWYSAQAQGLEESLEIPVINSQK